MKDEMNADDRVYGSTGWMIGDVLTLRPKWSEEKAKGWLEVNAKYIQDAMVRAGWAAMEALMTPVPEDVEGPGYANFYDISDKVLFSVPCSTPKAGEDLAERLYGQDESIADWTYTAKPEGKVG